MKGLILTYLLVALGTFGGLWSPAIGMYVYICLAVLRPQSLWGWAADLSGLSLLVGITMLVGWAARGFGSWKFGRGRILVITLLFFTAWCSLSALFANNSLVAWGFILNFAKIVAPFLVATTVLRSEKDARILMWVIVLSQAYICYEMNADYFFNGRNRVQDDGFGGMDNNCFAVGLVSTLGCALVLGISAKGWIERGVAAASALLIVHTVLLTYSRGGMLGLVAVGLAAFVIMRKSPRNMLAILAVLLLTIRLTGPQLAARYDTMFAEDKNATSEGRIELWGNALTVAQRYPIFGVGPYNWPLIAVDFGWTEGKRVHSTWMAEAAEVGFPGVLTLFMFYVLTVFKVWPIARSRLPGNESRALLASGIVMSLSGYIVSAQFVSMEGLEIPYYLVAAAIVLMKEPSPVPATAAAATPSRLGLQASEAH